MLFSINTDIIPSIRLIGFASYKEPWMHFKRNIDEYVLYIIKSGELYIQEDNQKYVLKKGDTLLLEPDHTHAGFRDSICSYYYIHLKHPEINVLDEVKNKEKLHEILKKRELSLKSNFLLEESPTDSICYLPKHYHIINDSEFLYVLKEAECSFYNKYENYKKLTSCQILCFLIQLSQEYTSSGITSLQSQSSKGFVKARYLLNYLNSEYCKKLTSADIEYLCELDYDYINKVFHKLTGYSIFNYLNMLRINKAKELIEATTIKFSEIGYLVGIEDPYYFCKLFKKHTGMTPTQYQLKMHDHEPHIDI